MDTFFGIYHYREAFKKNVNFCTIWVKMGWVPIFSHFSPIFPEWKNQLLLCYILTIYSNMDRKYFLFMYSTETERKKATTTTRHEAQTWISDGDDHDGKIVYNRVAIVLRPRHMILKSCVTLISYLIHKTYENHDIAIVMSPSRADPVLPWLGVFKYLYQCLSPGWEYLNIYISVSALAGSI